MLIYSSVCVFPYISISMVTKSALNAYTIIKEKDNNNVEPMYRSNAWDRVNSDKKKTNKKSGYSR